MKKRYLFIGLFLISIAAFGQQEQYDKIMETAFPAEGPGATAIVVKGGEVLYHKAFGQANVELGVPMQTDHVFRIGSITKQFTSMAVLKLAEDGKLSVEDEITKFLPDYPTQGHTITVHHLLNHTSGIKSYTGLEKWTPQVHRQDFTPLEMIDFFKDEPMDFAPGEEFRYNNSGYFILGYIIEKASGMTYEEYIETQFFAPLGMTQSYYGHPEEVTPKRVAGYSPGEEGGLQNGGYISMSQPYAAGSLLSTVGDLAKWYAAVKDGKVVSPASLKQALSPTVLNNGETEGYGYGLGLVYLEGSKGYGHGGGIHGFLTASTYLTEEDVFVAVFSNSNGNDPGGPANTLAKIAIGKYSPPKVVKVDALTLSRCAGDYELGPGFIVTVKVADNHLIGQATGQGPLELMPYAKDTYGHEAAGIKMKFDLSAASGVAPSFTLFQGGAEMVAKRVEE